MPFISYHQNTQQTQEAAPIMESCRMVQDNALCNILHTYLSNNELCGISIR